ncbi:Retinol dehydrogenase 13 [Pseudolycoriella hygida]|uniref:Retinol dehydrogenase 13 n=1 Tax=Pseudolycoriella hygida TaxID=35572 RepID=A0A9Q0MUL1_9DIPT|nr:Retinol dehydrogenase 13 [Pseudolycoriella hygida]
MDEIQSHLSNADPFQSWWPFIIAIGVGVVMTIKNFMGGQNSPSTNQINGQIVVITGGSGIGFEITKELCSRGAHVIVATKDIKKCQEKLEIIKRQIPSASVEVRHIDLKSFDCLKRFAKSVIKDFEKVDILINNAGIIFNPFDKTVDGFESHLQVNYLSHFLLSSLLLPLLKNATNGRIINVSAHANASGKVNIDDPLNIGQWAPAFHHRDAFAHSKLCVLLASIHLATVLKDTHVTVNTCTPGLVRGTDHLSKSPIMNAMCAKVITYPWMWLLMKSPTQGAQTAIYLATEPNLKTVSGQYFNDCEKAEINKDLCDGELAGVLFSRTLSALKMDSFHQ